MKAEDKASVVIVGVFLFIYGLALFYEFELVPMIVGWVSFIAMFALASSIVDNISTLAKPPKKKKKNRNNSEDDEKSTEPDDLNTVCWFSSVPLCMGILLFIFLGETLLPLLLGVMSLTVMYLAYILDTEIKKKITKPQEKDITENVI